MRPLITGMLPFSAGWSTVSWAKVRAMIPFPQRDGTLAVSWIVSPRPSCVSEAWSTTGWTPSWADLVEQNERKARGEKPPQRTGTFTRGIVSERLVGRKIVLYFTGQHHAGEDLARVLAERAAGLEPPILMCDALSRNAPGR